MYTVVNDMTFIFSFQDKPRLNGLTVLGYVIRKQPSWLYKLTQHGLIKELLKILKVRHSQLLFCSALIVLRSFGVLGRYSLEVISS